ncbi:hypothetical protein MLD38_022131 [Melastoma candidum]|uniref:Uncharacterized protein n=1 Tax=Melastoma candidum TaxID=119954 RepID=A0ACB9QLA0_9MYRT|nr:hypothetical protein MLD38_022131 [Melastoma candidum]
MESSGSGLTFKLHPLVFLNVSDHYTRVKCQLSLRSPPPPRTPTAAAFLRSLLSAFFFLFFLPFPRPASSSCSTPRPIHSTGPSSTRSQSSLMDINESPVYVILNPSINHAQKDLPVTIYESELHVIDGIPQLIFVHASYNIETVEAERISVDHIAHLKPSDGGSAATQLAAHLTGIHSAIKMLNSRVGVLHHHLVAMQKGETPCENSLLRQVSSLLRRLPAMESRKFQDDFLME